MNTADCKLTLMQDIAAVVENGSNEDVVSLQYLTTLAPSTRKALHHLALSIASIPEKDKAETLMRTLADKLHAGRGAWTVGTMVKTHLDAKQAQVVRLPSGKSRLRAEAYLKPVAEVAKHFVTYFGADTDIDSITPEHIAKWKANYIQDHSRKGLGGGDLAPTTVAARMNIVATFFNTAVISGWPGNVSCLFRANGTPKRARSPHY